MFEDDLDQGDTCQPELTLSATERAEIALIKRMMALPDHRPDPGVYCNADSEAAGPDVQELMRMLSLRDPRPFNTPWRPYLQPEDLFEDPTDLR
jgi:hypothetical protein